MERCFGFKFWLFVPIFILSSVFISCSGGESQSPEEKARLSRQGNDTLEIYDALEAYPGLENFLTYGELKRETFEEKLFGKFLGNDATADTIVTMIELFPVLINDGTVFSPDHNTGKIFTDDTIDEMESKGAVPNFISNVGVITQSVIDTPEIKKQPVYDYLEKLEQMEKSNPDADGVLDYGLNILADVVGFLDTLNEEDVNIFMNFFATDFLEMQTSETLKLDFNDVETFLEKLANQSPEGIVNFLQGLRGLFHDQEFRTTCSEFFGALGRFIGDPEVFQEIKTLLENLDDRYDVDSLGELIDRVWEKGPIIGPEVEKLNMDRYGANGKQDWGLREFLMYPAFLNMILETFYHFYEEGFGFDHLDDQLAKMVKNDPFCYDRKGDGEFGNGEFFQPTENVSFKDLSAFRGLFTIFARWNIPFTLTSPWIFETKGGEATKTLIRSLIPEVDTLTLSSYVWWDYYEKDPNAYMGGGSPLTEKKGYGIMRDGVYVAPSCPAVVAAANIPLFAMGESLVNGPHDNIYDNLKWLHYERNLYVVVDLIQIAPYVPMLKYSVLPALKLMGIQQMPIVFAKLKGATNLINLEISDVIEKLPSVLTSELVKYNLPNWMVDRIMEVVKRFLPLGTPIDDEPKIYLLAKDVRETAAIVWELPYYDRDAFHLDRFLNDGNPQDYMLYYDVRDYTYEKNADKANPFWNAAGALTVAGYLAYRDVVETFPIPMADIPARQEIAKENFGVVYPFEYLTNIFTPFSELSTESSTYDVSGPDIMPFLGLIEPFLEMDTMGCIDKLLKLLSIIGKPELKTAREQLTAGLAGFSATVREDSESPYTIAAELLRQKEKADMDSGRWDALKLAMTTANGILDTTSAYEITEDVLGLMNHLTGVTITEDAFYLAADGFVEVLKNGAENRILTRALIHLATILDEADKFHNWANAVDMMNVALIDDGVLSYILRGLEKDPEISWEQVFEDSNTFLHSELIQDYEEDSFWREVYYLLDFLAEAIE